MRLAMIFHDGCKSRFEQLHMKCHMRLVGNKGGGGAQLCLTVVVFNHSGSRVNPGPLVCSVGCHLLCDDVVTI